MPISLCTACWLKRDSEQTSSGQQYRPTGEVGSVGVGAFESVAVAVVSIHTRSVGMGDSKQKKTRVLIPIVSILE